MKNIAINKPAAASSQFSNSFLPMFAFDGAFNTRWSSIFSDPQWIYVDLCGIYHINQVILRWETASARAYKVQMSNDAANWTDIFSTTTGGAGARTDNLPGLEGVGRFVRMYGTVRNTTFGYSLWEFEVSAYEGGDNTLLTVSAIIPGRRR